MLKIGVFWDVMPCSQVRKLYTIYYLTWHNMPQDLNVQRLVYFVWYWCVLHIALERKSLGYNFQPKVKKLQNCDYDCKTHRLYTYVVLWALGWVAPRDGVGNGEERNLVPLLGIESRFLSSLARSLVTIPNTTLQVENKVAESTKAGKWTIYTHFRIYLVFMYIGNNGVGFNFQNYYDSRVGITDL